MATSKIEARINRCYKKLHDGLVSEGYDKVEVEALLARSQQYLKDEVEKLIHKSVIKKKDGKRKVKVRVPSPKFAKSMKSKIDKFRQLRDEGKL